MHSVTLSHIHERKVRNTMCVCMKLINALDVLNNKEQNDCSCFGFPLLWLMLRCSTETYFIGM